MRRTARDRLRWRQRALPCVVALALTLATSGLAQEWVYTARPGDTLSGLAVEHLNAGYGVTDLQAYNRLPDANSLPVGTRLRVPVAWLKLQPTPATLVRLSGDVARSREDGEATEPLAAGVRLYAGDTLHTGNDGVATIEFADRSRMILRPDSSVTLDTLSAMGTSGMVDTSMRLHGGRIENIVEPQRNPDSRYRVVTPPAVAAVRGTEFRVGYAAVSERMTGEVADGTIGVSAQGVSRAIPAGFGVVTVLGEAPGEPVQLLPAPDLSQLPARVPQTNVAFDWPALPGAVTYRSELFAGEQFEQLARSVTVDAPALEFAGLALGVYRLQMRAVDAAGLAGSDAHHDFEVLQPPVPPALIAPPDLSDRSDSDVTLRWSAPPGMQRFRLQVARDRAFTDLILERTDLDDIRYRLRQDLPPGRYHWRVAGMDDITGEASFARAFEFTVWPTPGTPEALHVTTPAHDTLVFRWSPVADAAGYRLLLARDRRFHDLALDIDTTAAELRVAKPRWGRYFYRVQGLDANGRGGEPSRAHSLQVPRWMPAPGMLLLLVPLLIAILLHLRLRGTR